MHKYFLKNTEKNTINMKFMENNQLTRFVYPSFKTFGRVHKATGEDTVAYFKLLTQRNLKHPTDVQAEHCLHYVIKKNDKVVAGMSVLTTNINNSNFRICCSVELLVSTEKGSAKMFLELLRKNLKKRNGTCYLVTQSYQGKLASEFWNKHLTRHKEADALNFMMFMLDNRYLLCEDVDYLRICF